MVQRDEARVGGEAPDAALDPGEIAELSFEAALERLEQVVDRLEGGDLALERALQTFAEGVALSNHCAGRLDAAERRIEVLVQEGDRWVTQPFGAASDDAEGDASDEDWEEDEVT